MNSFITWIGGKKQLREAIVSRFPKEGIQKYVEVFGGAGWVLFHRDKHAPKEVYNDINSNLVNLFRMMKHHPEAVEKELEYALNSREMYQMCRKTIDREDLTEIQRAARFLFLIKTSYSGKVSSFGCQTRDVLQLKNLEEIKKRLSTVLIENRSFVELIKRHDGSGTLFYCDPPYYETEKYYDTGDFVFDESQHILLRDKLANIKGKFVLSYNDHPFIRELYQGFVIEEVERSNSLGIVAGGEKRYKELIIRNYM